MLSQVVSFHTKSKGTSIISFLLASTLTSPIIVQSIFTLFTYITFSLAPSF